MKMLLCGFLLFTAPLLFSQNQVINFKKLQEFLPTITINDFQREKPIGSTQNAMGIGVSDASVVYQQISSSPDGHTVSYEIKISDAVFNPYVVMQFTMLGENYSSESESGYEKFTKIAGKYPGKISVTTEGYPSCQYDFAVGNRILISLRCNGAVNLEQLDSFIASMKLDSLAELKP